METIRFSNRKLAVLRAARVGLKLTDAIKINQITFQSVVNAGELIYNEGTEMYALSEAGEKDYSLMIGSNVREMFVMNEPEARTNRIMEKLTAAVRARKLAATPPPERAAANTRRATPRRKAS